MTRAAARQRQRRVNARWRAVALPGSYTTFWDTTRCYCTTVARNNQLDAGFTWNPGFLPTSPEAVC
jgi:hypothetical protein